MVDIESSARKEDGTEIPREEQTKRQERADRILDAAGDLLLRWGYRKTTIEDIARQAGVAKSTIYVHWKTREDLFLALFTRERLRESERFLEEARTHPEMMTLSGLAKYSLLSTLRNPLLKAVLLQDTNILGSLVKAVDYSRPDIQDWIKGNLSYFQYFRDLGLIRSDKSLEAYNHMFIAIFMGFLTTEVYLPEEFMVSDEERAEQLAQVIHRSFELRSPTAEDLSGTATKLSNIVHTLHEIEEKGIPL
jgi:AcrR family transcriptional regulator